MQALFGSFFTNPPFTPPQAAPTQHAQGPSLLPQLPLPILQRILHLGGLPSADILALAATCRALTHCAPLAYHSLHFPLDASAGTPRGMRALLRTLQLLMQTICSRRGHPAHIRRITLFAARAGRPQSAATPPGDVEGAEDDPFALPDSTLLAHALRDVDFVLAQLVALAPHLHTFVLDASAVGLALAFPATLAVLAHDRERTFAEFALVRVCSSPFTGALPVAGGLRARRVTLRSEDAPLVRAFLGAPVGLRELDFRESIANTDPWTDLFSHGLHQSGRTRDVERLVLTCTGQNASFEDHTEFVRGALVSIPARRRPLHRH